MKGKFAVAVLMGIGLALGCSSGGGGGGSPFPKAVTQILDDLDDALRGGAPDLPPTISCGVVGNPFDSNVGTNTQQIAGSGDDHEGTVASATEQELEIRNPNGSGTITYTVVDSSDPGRVFLEIVGTFGVPKINFKAPPIGAMEFLLSDGTGQVFAVLTIERQINWTSTFENDPFGAVGSGTLVGFSGPLVIPVQPDGTISGWTKEKHTFLVEFDVLAGPPINSACVVDFDRIGEVETIFRKGAGMSISPLSHSHDAFADTLAGPINAFQNTHAIVAPVGTDALLNNPVGDGDPVHLANGLISGGIKGFPLVLLVSDVNDAGGAFNLVSDGVGDPTDGDFDAVLTYNIDGTFSVNAGPGGLNNGVVEASILRVNSKQEEDPAFDNFNHPILDEFSLYGEMMADTDTGVVIFR